MSLVEPTYAEKLGVPCHRSFFRDALARRAGSMGPQEYLIDQANLRGFRGAYSDRSDLGELDPALSLEDIVVGLLQPQAPAEVRVVKLIVRMLQSGRLDPARLWLGARREKADSVLAWVLGLIPEQEQNEAVQAIQVVVDAHPVRDTRRPTVRYDPKRLLRVKARVG